jgi:hypothetical protein
MMSQAARINFNKVHDRKGARDREVEKKDSVTRGESRLVQFNPISECRTRFKSGEG